MEGETSEFVPTDQPECDEPITDEKGRVLSRYTDYWAWHDAIKKQLFN